MENEIPNKYIVGANSIIEIMRYIYPFDEGVKVLAVAFACSVKVTNLTSKSNKMTEKEIMDFFNLAMKTADEKFAKEHPDTYKRQHPDTESCDINDSVAQAIAELRKVGKQLNIGP